MTKPYPDVPPEPLVWTPELVSRFWDGLAQAGIDDIMAFGGMAKRCIHWLVDRHLVRGGRHLDFGAGGGEVTAYLIEQGFAFAVHEPSVERLRKTEERLAHLAGFLGGVAPDGKESFDAVTCFEVLEHVLDQDFEAICDRLAAFVRLGGKLVISTPNNEDLARDTIYCPISNKFFHRWQHVRRISPEDMTAIFARRGFRKVCVHQLDFDENLFASHLHHLGLADTPDAAKPPSTQAASNEGAGWIARLNPLRSRRRVQPEHHGPPPDVVPLHIHQIVNDVDGIMGGATRLLYIGVKDGSA